MSYITKIIKIDSWTSDKEEHKIKGLEEGKTYILHEEVTADGYVKATDIEFTVSYDKQNEHLEMVDKVLKVIKTDLVTGEEIEGAELLQKSHIKFQDLKKVKNTH